MRRALRQRHPVTTGHKTPIDITQSLLPEAGPSAKQDARAGGRRGTAGHLQILFKIVLRTDDGRLIDIDVILS